MSIGLIAIKCGMTRIFDLETGASIPVTVAEVKPNKIVQIKTLDNDGYVAIQVTQGEAKLNRLTKGLAGHYAKANVVPGKGLWEFRVTKEESESMAVGGELAVELFTVGQKIDVAGLTKGRGFTGTITRHNFRSQRASHGNSLSHNVPGSIGQNQTPGRVFKGKKMAGQYGNTRQMIQNLEVVRVDKERNVLLIKGGVPGAPGGKLMICPSVKQKSKSTEAAA